MSERLRTALAALPARQLNLLCIGVVAIAAMLAWTACVRGPLVAWRQQGAALAALRASATAPAATRAAEAAAAAALPAAPPTPLALIGALGHAAKPAGVTVTSAAQGGERTVAGLRQQTVDVTATGAYGAILAWLDGIERTQPAVGIVQLELQPGDAGGQRKATLQLAIYGPPSQP
jgi:type II secretory pathway component PulM